MFFGSTRIFDNGFQEVLFSDDGSCSYLLLALTFLYSLAVSISIFVIFNFVFQRLFSRWKLKYTPSPKVNDKIHIFFGVNKYSMLLLRDIPNDDRIYFIDYPTEKDEDYDISFTSGLSKLFKRGRSRTDVIYLKAKNKLSDIELSDKTIAEILDLKGIDDLIFRSNSYLYFLSDNEKENISSLNNIRLRKHQISADKDIAMKVCHVYCHAKKEGYNISREDKYKNDFDITFVDSSYLAIQQVIREDYDSLPVNFVKIKTESWNPSDDKALPLSNDYNIGYVESAFNAAIFGFGELGHDAFDFLYEYGAFVDSRGVRSPFHVDVYDKNVIDNDTSITDIIRNYPGLKDTAKNILSFKQSDFSASDSWNSLTLDGLNYIFVCAGNDELNLRILENIDKCFSSIQNPQTLRVMVKHSSRFITSILPSTINKISSCIHFFGSDEDIWKMDIISNQSLIADAKKYYAAYAKVTKQASSPAEAEAQWIKREDEISNLQSPNRKKRIRQRSQDFANCLHLETKKRLIGEKFLAIATELSKSIPSSYSQNTPVCVNDEPHCSDCPDPTFSREMLNYLAKEEHIRWEASHIVMGYSYGHETDDNNKTHSCLVEYDKVPDYPNKEKQINYGETRHYDWIVIKTSLEMAAAHK